MKRSAGVSRAYLSRRRSAGASHACQAKPRRTAKAWSHDGTLRHVELSFGPLRHADGRTNYWVVAFSDRSELEKLRAEIESLRTLQAAA